MSDMPKRNTDKELWREVPGDYYSPSIYVTEGGGIGINVGGTVYVMPVKAWHALRADLAGYRNTVDLMVENEGRLREENERLKAIVEGIAKGQDPVKTLVDGLGYVAALRAENERLKAEAGYKE